MQRRTAPRLKGIQSEPRPARETRTCVAVRVSAVHLPSSLPLATRLAHPLLASLPSASVIALHALSRQEQCCNGRLVRRTDSCGHCAHRPLSRRRREHGPPPAMPSTLLGQRGAALAAYACGVSSAALIAVWLLLYCGGLGWSRRLLFNWHPLLMAAAWLVCTTHGHTPTHTHARAPTRTPLLE